jgi:transposase
MMRPPNDGITVYVCVEPIDFRKQINGLSALVQDVLALDPFSEHLFAFRNRRRHQATYNIPFGVRRGSLSVASAAR